MRIAHCFVACQANWFKITIGVWKLKPWFDPRHKCPPMLPANAQLLNLHQFTRKASEKGICSLLKLRSEQVVIFLILWWRFSAFFWRIWGYHWHRHWVCWGVPGLKLSIPPQKRVRVLKWSQGIYVVHSNSWGNPLWHIYTPMKVR